MSKKLQVEEIIEFFMVAAKYWKEVSPTRSRQYNDGFLYWYARL